MIKFAKPSELAKAGILGMNRRNASFIARYNPRHLYPLVDDKLETKLLAEEFDLPTPKLLGVIRRQHEIRGLRELLEPHPNFVLKPSCGSAGKGILVITSRKGDQYVKPSGEALEFGELRKHANNTLSGLYSLGGRNDKILIERCINFSDAFEGFSYEGVPDVRVILFKGYPVMAMMRLSTSASDGKANLHQGAVGVGIHLGTGKAINAVQFNKPVTKHPDTQRNLMELEVPQWDELVGLASKCYDMTEMAYLGADIVLDAAEGPQLLELNARPGLSIQIANATGLTPRLEQIEALGRKAARASAEERIAYSIKHFS